MKAKDILNALKGLINETPLQAAQKLDYDSGSEVGMKHPYKPNHLLLRDDGVSELAAGPGCSLHLDSAQGLATLKGNSVNVFGNYIHLLGKDIYVRFCKLDPLNLWTTPTEAGGVINLDLWTKAPIVQNGPESLKQTFLVGKPAAGQWEVPFSTVFQARPLFGPDETDLIIMRNLAVLTKAIAHPH